MVFSCKKCLRPQSSSLTITISLRLLHQQNKYILSKHYILITQHNFYTLHVGTNYVLPEVTVKRIIETLNLSMQKQTDLLSQT